MSSYLKVLAIHYAHIRGRMNGNGNGYRNGHINGYRNGYGNGHINGFIKKRKIGCNRFKIIMLLVFSIFSLCASSSSFSYDTVVGWHWYNELVEQEPKEEPKKKEEAMVSAFSKLPASGQLKILQMATNELKDKAVLSGNVSDIRAYKEAQDFWVNKATQFTVGWEKMLLLNPALDYSLSHTHENAYASIEQREDHAREDRAVRQLAKQSGLVFFYQSKDKGGVQFAKTVSRYATRYHFVLVPISIDSGVGNKGHEKARLLGVHYFPALVLVNPKTKTHQVVSYGFKSESELSERLLKLSNGWKAGF